MGYRHISARRSSCCLLNNVAGINVTIAFRMGDDIGSLLASPVGQPMATVSMFTFLSMDSNGFHCRLDPAEQFRKAGDTCCLVVSRHCTVSDTKLTLFRVTEHSPTTGS